MPGPQMMCVCDAPECGRVVAAKKMQSMLSGGSGWDLPPGWIAVKVDASSRGSRVYCSVPCLHEAVCEEEV